MAPYGAEAWDCGFVRREFPESRLRQEGGASERNGVKMSSEWQENVALAKGAWDNVGGKPMEIIGNRWKT